MFARTERLLLRPAFPEDAPALAAAIGDERIARNLANVPWPYGLSDAEAFIAAPRDPVLPSLLITERTAGAPWIVGACGLGRRSSGSVELGFWIAKRHWGRGLASEAGTALVAIARALRLPRLEASHFVDNARSALVLAKLGFEPTGIVAPRFCCALGKQVPARLYRLTLAGAQASHGDASEDVLAA